MWNPLYETEILNIIKYKEIWQIILFFFKDNI